MRRKIFDIVVTSGLSFQHHRPGIAGIVEGCDTFASVTIRRDACAGPESFFPRSALGASPPRLPIRDWIYLSSETSLQCRFAG